MNERAPIRIRPFNPMRAIGYLFRVRGGQLGSCFAFHKMPYFLTASHCVRDTPAAELGILLPAHSEHFVKIESVSVHPEADIAVLRADQTFLNVDPFWTATKRVLIGQDFATYGYPDVPEQPQFAKGYFQRFREHRSHMGFEYLAGEVNTAIETGVSGAPLFDPEDHGRVFSVATESFTSSIVAESVEERAVDGTVSTTVSKRIVAHGVSVLLWPLVEWLTTQLGAQRDVTT